MTDKDQAADEAATIVALAQRSNAELISLIAPHLEGEPYLALDVLEERQAAGALLIGEVADTPDAKLVAALARAQAAFPSIPKTKTGEVRGSKNGRDYSYNYSYADLGDVLAAVRPALAANGLAVVQRTTTEAGKVTLITELRHAGGGILESVVELGQSSGNPQAFGGALTYLRRYELGTLIGVAPEEDTDARDVPVSTGRQAAPPAELPPWATDLTNGRLVELGARLKVLLGDEGARDAARTIKHNLGGIPAIVAMTTGLMLDTVLEQNPDELLSRLADEQARRLDVKRQAEAELAKAEEAAAADEAKARQDAAEAPDSPAGEETDDAPAPPQTTEDVLERANAATNPPASGPELAPAGRTPVPDVSALEGLDAEAALREAGCICNSPLEATLNERHRNDQCPLIGHGIPF